MRNLYSSLYLISTVLVMAVAISSCSENEEDIAAPSITYTYPAENDTIQVVNNSITIIVTAQDKVKLDEMAMVVKSQSEYFPYNSEYKKDDIDSQTYTCNEKFYLSITKTTRMKLIVSFQNKFHNWNKKEIDFYVKL
jgi:hypothetical protein